MTAAKEHVPGWFEDRDEVLSFARALAGGEVLDDTHKMLYFFGKPWKWTEEHAAWCAAGCPDSFDPESQSSGDTGEKP